MTTSSQPKTETEEDLENPPDKLETVEEEEETERARDEQQFYERLLRIPHSDDVKAIDTSDYQFLCDFAIVSVTMSVYTELQANRFFDQTRHREDGENEEEPEEEKDQELERLQAFETKGKFRLCQLYPLVLRSVIGYYNTIALNYYEDTLEQRRLSQAPIGLNDKAYAILCNSVRKLVLMEMEFSEERVAEV